MSMEVKKATLSQLFKDGDSFSFKKVDYNSSSVSREIEKVKDKQEESLRSAEVNLNELRKIVFTL